MNIAVVGASGVLGPSLVALLHRSGQRVRVIGRHRPGSLPPGVDWVRGDLLQPDSLGPALHQIDAVVNLASAIPVKLAPTPDDWRANDAVRDQGTLNLLGAMQSARIGRFVQGGVHLVFGMDRGDELLTEEAAVDPPPPLRSAVVAEDHLRDCARQGLIQTTSLRLGWLHGPRSWHTDRLLSQLQAGGLVVPRTRRWWWSTVSSARAAAAARIVLDHHEPPAVLHVADGPAIDVAELLTAVAERYGWPAPRAAEQGASPELLRSVRLDIRRAADLGIEPGDPVAALVDTAASWQKEKATSVS